ncbi:MAG TPA: hypothetical protein ENN05_05825 [Deltaproteobacteria bacterium]|nr:hypothetical protein [Deltaproteobacteria bacterium]
METIPFIVGAVMAIFSVVLLHRAKKDWGYHKLVKGISLSPIRHIQPGMCLVEGVVESEETILTPYTKTPSVWHRWKATAQQELRKNTAEESLSTGEQGCPFVLKDSAGRITVEPEGGTAISYPHNRVLKSLSNKFTGIGKRIHKMKEMDEKQYGPGEKKPFFRKLEQEAPLDIPDDLVEIVPGSDEARQALRKYYESWVEPGDRVFVLGTVSVKSGWKNLCITKDSGAPLMLSNHLDDLSAGEFYKGFIVQLLSGVILAVISICILGYSFGISL